MAKVSRLIPFGNQLVVQLSDGTKILTYPSGSDLWYPGPNSGSGGSGGGTGGWQTPLDMTIWKVTDNYGMRVDPVTGVNQLHAGIDLSGPGVTGTDIWAVADGTIYENAYSSGSGNRVGIQHADGTETLYFHMLNPSSVVVGAPVHKGDVIGQVGSTGQSTGAHLHFQCQYSPPWNDSNSLDPRVYMADPSRMGHDPFPPYP